ncbi:MAG: DUF3137 domain-containing protein [Clostridia bacterium]|nr:DUF3137 domain-containing protein [Clostridia bacterium]
MKKYDESNIELKRKISLFMYLCMFAFFIAIIVYVIFAKNYNAMIIGALFLATAACFVTGIGLKMHVTPYLSEMLLKKVNTKIDNLEFFHNKGIPEKLFRDSGFVKKYISYNSYNFTTGKVKDYDFIFSDSIVRNITSTSGKNESVVIFKGIFGITDAKIESNVDMVIAPDVKNKLLNNLSEDVKKIFGANKHVVRLENIEFERYFEVYSNDQVEARRIVTLKFMENLLELKKRLNKNVTVIYKENRIYFFVENRFLINSFKLYLCGANQEMVDETTEILNLLAETVSSI